MQIVLRPVIPYRSQEFFQTRTFRIHIDPYKTGKRLAAYLLQPDILTGIPLGKVFRVLSKQQRTISCKCPSRGTYRQAALHALFLLEATDYHDVGKYCRKP